MQLCLVNECSIIIFGVCMHLNKTFMSGEKTQQSCSFETIEFHTSVTFTLKSLLTSINQSINVTYKVPKSLRNVQRR